MTGLRSLAPSGQPSFESLDSMEGIPLLTPAEAALPPGVRLRLGLRRIGPGLAVAGVIAMAAAWLADHYGAPVMLFALLLGMAVNFLSQSADCRPGIDFCARTVLRIGVALLGARIGLEQVLALGGGVLLIAASGVVVTILAGWLLARAFKLGPDFGVLTGGSVAICGASAALAISSILPPSEERERDTILTVVGVTALSTVAMIVYPLAAASLGLSDHQTGVLLGATIHDVAQVVGAGYGVSKEAGDAATIVKLFRVALLVPVVIVIAMLFRGGEGRAKPSKRLPLVPLFLVGFVALVAVNSAGFLPAAGLVLAGDTSRWCLVTAIAAVGMKTSLGDVVKIGWKPVALVVLETAIVFAWALGWIAAL